MEQQYRCLPEVRYYKFYFNYFFFTTMIIFIPLFSLHLFNQDQVNIYGYMTLMYFLVFLPFNLYYLYQWYYYKKLVPTHIQITMLDQVESNFIRNVAFVVEMDINGHKKRISTMHAFRTGWFGPNDVSEYSMRKAKVGYDPNRGIAVVLEIVKD